MSYVMWQHSDMENHYHFQAEYQDIKDEHHGNLDADSLEPSIALWNIKNEEYPGGDLLEKYWNPLSPELGEDFLPFQQTPLESWTGEDCLDWATFICQKHHIDSHDVDVTPFRRISGTQLLRYKVQHFSAIIGDCYGATFFEEFRVLRKLTKTPKRGRSERSYRSTTYEEGLLDGYDDDESGSAYTSESWTLTSEEFDDLDRYCLDEEDTSSSSFQQDIDPSIVDHLLDLNRLCLKQEEDDEDYSQGQAYCPEYPSSSGVPSSSLESPTGELEDVAKRTASDKVPTKSKRRERKPKIWEFLVRLLCDPQTNPLLVKWQDETDGVFRLTNPEFVARLWGARNNKPNLSYNNFARSLRYHYNTGAIELVRQQHFMYRCGPKALQYLERIKSGT